MKIIIPLFVFAISVLLLSGCDLNTLPLNVPVSVEVTLSGNSSSVTSTGTVNLADYEDLRNENVNKVTFVQAAFRVKSVSDPNLTGNISVTLENNSGFFYTKTLNNVKPADYMTTPYLLELTAEQIQSLNDYLETISDQTFTGTVSVTNISGGNPPYTIVGVIDFVLEAETEI